MKNIRNVVELVSYFSGDSYIDESVVIFNENISEKVPELKEIINQTPINKHLYRDIIKYFQSKVYTITDYEDEAVIFEVSEKFQKYVLNLFRQFDENNSDELLLNLLDLTGQKICENAINKRIY